MYAGVLKIVFVASVCDLFLTCRICLGSPMYLHLTRDLTRPHPYFMDQVLIFPLSFAAKEYDDCYDHYYVIIVGDDNEVGFRFLEE